MTTQQDDDCDRRPADDLARALRQLRTIAPSAELMQRLDQSLRSAERTERAAPSRWLRVKRAADRHFMLMVPGIASVAVALHVLVAEPNFDAGRTAEHAVELSAAGEGALNVDLWLEAHDADYASVRFHVPLGVTLTTGDGPADVLPSPDCHATGCVYEFMHPTHPDARPVQVRVKAPGRYRMHVEHASDGRRVHEVVVVHARR